MIATEVYVSVIKVNVTVAKYRTFIITGENMTCIDFGFTWSKGQGHKNPFCKKGLSLIFRTIYHRAIIFHILTGLGEYMTSIDFGFTKINVNVTRVTCKKCKHGFRSLS